MKEDQVRWDKRYAEKEYAQDPNPLLVEYYSLANKGKALDIAAGNGRNSLFLQNQGFEVEAIDISEVALELIKQKHPKINTQHVDLDRHRLKEKQYDIIVNCNYLNRGIFADIRDALRPKGLLFFRTFVEGDQGRNPETPYRKEFYLQRNELLHSFLSLDIHLYQEEYFTQDDGKARAIATLVAQKRA